MDTSQNSFCGSASSALLKAECPALTRQAFRLEWLTVASMIVEGAVAVGAGIAAGSLTLTAYGLDSVIELASACVLMPDVHTSTFAGQFGSATRALALLTSKTCERDNARK
jgi:hypothetical protein